MLHSDARTTDFTNCLDSLLPPHASDTDTLSEQHYTGDNLHLFDNSERAEDDSPIPGSDLTKGQFLAMSMAFALKHRLTGVAFQDFLTLLNTAFPGALPKTLYMLKKCFSKKQACVINYVCPECAEFIGLSIPLNCAACQASLLEKDLINKMSYFLTLSITEQLTDFLENHNMMRHVETYRAGSYDTNVEKLHLFLSNPYNISLSCNVDGVPVFKSSNIAMWPILVSVNEIPIPVRRRFMMLHSLWFGPNKPRIDTFLQPFIAEVQKLHTDGLPWTDLNGCLQLTRCAVSACICDSVARPMVQNVIQFNGKFGCGYCMHPGQVIQKGAGRVRVYPVDGKLYNRRSHSDTIDHARKALDDGAAHFGVKGPSVFAEVPHFDTVSGFAPDYMHCVCLGVVRQIVNMSLDSSNHLKPYYLASRIEEIDELLKLQSPPSEITRTPRSITQKQYWKASEWRAFLLFYSVVIFAKVMQRRYYNHWLCLVCGMLLLLSPKVTNMEIKHAQRCFLKFVVQFADLYGTENLSYNVHLLLHLGDSTKIYGCLQNTSAFIYEDACGHLLKAFHGTQGVPLQIVDNFMAHHDLFTIRNIYSKTVLDDNISDVLFLKDSAAHISKKAIKLACGCTVFGAPVKHVLSMYEKVAIENVANLQINDDVTVSRYSRFCYRGKIFCTKSYSMAFKRNNSVIQFGVNKFGCIKYFLVLRRSCSCDDAACSCDLISEPVVIVEQFRVMQRRIRDEFVECNLTQAFWQVRPTDIIDVCHPSQIVAKCVAINDEDNKIIVKLPVFECD